jgi:hypothetical protein
VASVLAGSGEVVVELLGQPGKLVPDRLNAERLDGENC